MRTSAALLTLMICSAFFATFDTATSDAQLLRRFRDRCHQGCFLNKLKCFSRRQNCIPCCKPVQSVEDCGFCRVRFENGIYLVIASCDGIDGGNCYCATPRLGGGPSIEGTEFSAFCYSVPPIGTNSFSDQGFFLALNGGLGGRELDELGRVYVNRGLIPIGNKTVKLESSVFKLGVTGAEYKWVVKAHYDRKEDDGRLSGDESTNGIATVSILTHKHSYIDVSFSADETRTFTFGKWSVTIHLKKV